MDWKLKPNSRKGKRSSYGSKNENNKHGSDNSNTKDTKDGTWYINQPGNHFGFWGLLRL